MSVDPTGADLKRLLADDPGGPVVMLNLLRFKRDGRSGYEEYARRILPFLDEIGAEVVYAGDCSTTVVGPETGWDMVLLIRYPSRQMFTTMVANRKYQEITHMRTEALEDALLQATTPWPEPEPMGQG